MVLRDGIVSLELHNAMVTYSIYYVYHDGAYNGYLNPHLGNDAIQTVYILEVVRKAQRGQVT